ncbi:MAG: Na+:solute symporter [Acidobacteriota bacterium]|nr:Na+:solute symporter [Acidobacteriota bacterium]
MHFLDWSLVAVFLIYVIVSGWRSRAKASKNLEEYFLAGRTLKGWQAGLSMAATQFASDTPLLVTGMIAMSGIFALWQLWVYALAFLLMGFLLAPCWRRASVLTDAELTELRYGEKPAAALRLFKALYFGTLFNCTVLAWVFFAAGRIAEPFLLWNEWLPPGLFDLFRGMVEQIGIPLTIITDPNDPMIWVRSTNNFLSIAAIVMVTFLYSATGGLRAVVATDIFQLTIMLAATAGFAFVVVDAVGGLGAISEGIRTRFSGGGPDGITPDQILAMTPDRAKDAALPLLAVLALQWLIQLNADGTGYLAQRSMACRSDDAARNAAIIFTFTQVLLRSLLWLPIALGLLLLFPPDLSLPLETLRAEREATYVRGIAELLPIGLKGLMLTGMLAALASTVDTHLNWGASYWTNDIYKRFICQMWLKRKPSDRSLVWVARASNLLILVISLLIGTQLTSINTVWQISLLLGAGIGPILILRWIWWRMTAYGEIAAILASLVLAPTLFFTVDDQALRLLLAAAGAVVSSLVAVYAFGSEDENLLRAFFAKVHPPGFWGHIAGEEEGKNARRKLGRGLLRTASCGITVFALLLGCGSLVAGSPAPVWLPWRPVWIVLVLVVGLALIPTWYPKSKSAEEPG